MDAKIKRMPSPCKDCADHTPVCKSECIAWKIYEATLETWRKEHDEEWRKRQPQHEYDHDKNDKIKKLRDRKERRI